MSGLKKFLTFVADKGKSFFSNVFTKRKDTASHLTDLCEQLISEDGVVSGISPPLEYCFVFMCPRLNYTENGLIFKFLS